eukprot:m.268241 g.268241  ORF g.268241 m.268241 type:complete len:368 (+) comp77669_c0_seq1:96-1199(+)
MGNHQENLQWQAAEDVLGELTSTHGAEVDKTCIDSRYNFNAPQCFDFEMTEGCVSSRDTHDFFLKPHPGHELSKQRKPKALLKTEDLLEATMYRRERQRKEGPPGLVFRPSSTTGGTRASTPRSPCNVTGLSPLKIWSPAKISNTTSSRTQGALSNGLRRTPLKAAKSSLRQGLLLSGNARVSRLLSSASETRSCSNTPDVDMFDEHSASTVTRSSCVSRVSRLFPQRTTSLSRASPDVCPSSPSHNRDLHSILAEHNSKIKNKHTEEQMMRKRVDDHNQRLRNNAVEKRPGSTLGDSSHMAQGTRKRRLLGTGTGTIQLSSRVTRSSQNVDDLSDMKQLLDQHNKRILNPKSAYDSNGHRITKAKT